MLPATIRSRPGPGRADGVGHNGPMSTTSLVVLAAGRGTRFGGPKQLVAVTDDGATITDVAIDRAAAAGIDRAVVVVSAAVIGPMSDHLADRATGDVTIVEQAGTRGTAQALLAARDVTDGPVVVVNADDVYPAATYEVAARHLAEGESAGHAVLGFALAQTMYGNRPQSRALIEADHGRLTGLREGTVSTDPTLTFTPKDDRRDPEADAGGGGPAVPAPAEGLTGDELVSMNAMVLQRGIFDRLADALQASTADEVYLPDVVADLVADGVEVRVLPCDGACHGLTYAEDVSTIASLL